MITFDRQQLLQPQELRQERKSLKLLREAFQQQKQHESLSDFSKKKPELEMLMSSMRVNRLRNTFYKKLTLNNIFHEPIRLELLSQEEKNSKRLIKIKGIYLHSHVLSLIFLLQMIFLIITFLISSWMAFIPDFIQSKDHRSPTVFILDVLTLITSCVNFAIMSMSQKIENGILVSYITDIVLRYARSLKMVADLLFIGILGVLIIARHSGYQSMEHLSVVLFVCCIARIIYSNTNLTLFRTTFMTSTRMDQYYKLIHLIIFNLIFTHFIASMLLAMAAINTTDNWLTHKEIQQESWYVQYSWSYYWATTIMMTVGFGDYTAVTYEEAYIVAFLEFFSCIVLAYNITEIGIIISTIRASQNDFIIKIALFKRMAHQNEIEHELKNKIESYLREERAIKQKFEFNEQNQLIQMLPEPLRKEYVMSSNGRFFKYLPFFKTLQKSTIVKFSQKLTSKVYYPGQLLYRADQCTSQIMILKEGKVGLTYRKMDSKLNGIIIEEIEIKEREFLTNEGEKIIKKIPILLTTQFLTPGKTTNYDMTALTYSNVSLLSHQNFLSIIKESDIDTEYFFSLIHEHSPNGNSWEQLPCESCMSEFKKKGDKNGAISNDGSTNQNNEAERFQFHTKFDCPRLHYFPLYGVIIYKQLMLPGKPQQRKTIFHRKQHKTNQSCLTLRKYAYKTYEQRKMISEKKLLQKQTTSKIVVKHQIQIKNDKSDRRFQDISVDKEYNEDSKRLFEEKKIQQKTIQNKQLDQTFTNDSLYEENLKDSLKLTFWNIQIDLMANYYNYFPQQNGARLDNVELSHSRISKIKVSRLTEELLKTKSTQELRPEKKVLEKTQAQIINWEKQKYEQKYKNINFFYPKNENPTLGDPTVKQNVRLQYFTGANNGVDRMIKTKNDSFIIYPAYDRRFTTTSHFQGQQNPSL